MIAASIGTRGAPLRARLLIKPMQFDPMIVDRLAKALRYTTDVPYALFVLRGLTHRFIRSRYHIPESDQAIYDSSALPTGCLPLTTDACVQLAGAAT